MKKTILLFLALCFVLLCACGAEKNPDEQFLQAFKEGLMARWDISLTSSDANDYSRLVDAELSKIGNFNVDTIQDPKLQDLAKQYLSALNDSRTAIGYMSVDAVKFLTDWQNAYNRRMVLIEEICEAYNLSFPQKYDTAVDSVHTSAPAAKLSLARDEAVKKIVDSAKVEAVDDDSSFREYSITVTNSSEYDIPNLSLEIALYDSDGVLVDTCYAEHIAILRAGQKAIVSFYTGKEFDTYEIFASYFE